MQAYCYHCMKPLNGSSVCPHCHRNIMFAVSAPYHLKAGTVLADRYLVGESIGEGGFGITYIGLDQTLSKRVAIKEFYPSGAANRTGELSDGVVITRGREGFFQKGVERFLVEAKSVAAFSEEDGIVDVLDHFRANNTAYIVMEYLDGENLRDYINHHGRFRSGDLISLMMPVMKSLRTIHAEGIIHRDISPDNIMFTKNGKLKLMDFGSARYYTNEERHMSVVLKKGYAPEEQYGSNTEQGPYTDVYALCATIYTCITGREPADSLDRLRYDSLTPPSSLGISISPVHEQALMHGLAVRAENRCRDMDQLIKEFSGTVPVKRTVSAEIPYTGNSGGSGWQNNNNQQYNGGEYQDRNGYGDQQYYYTQPKKSNSPIIIAIIISAVAVIAVGGAIAFLLITRGDSAGDDPSSSHVPISHISIPDTSYSESSEAETPESSYSEPSEESSEIESSKIESSYSESKTTLSQDEINDIVTNQIVPMYVNDVDDNRRMNEVRSGGKYDYALCPNNHIWVGTKGSFHDDSQIKRWYFFDSNHKLYFAYERTAETELRYYVYNDEVIKLTVGIHDVETQRKYYQGDSAIDSSVQQIVSDSYQALSTIP